MPVMELKNKSGQVKWIYVHKFERPNDAIAYMQRSMTPMRIIKENKKSYWVCYLWDAEWITSCGYREIKTD